MMIKMLSAFLVSKLLFFPAKTLDQLPSHLDAPYEEVRIRNSEGLLLHGWYFPGQKTERTLLYLHGNAGNIGTRTDKLLFLRRVGWNILIIDYRGYGGSEGNPTIDGVIEDAKAAHDWLTQGDNYQIPAERIILWGESLGGAIAAELAAQKKIGGLILQSTFTSLREIATDHYPWVPKNLVPDRFRTIETIRHLPCPLFIVHGSEDSTIPVSMGRHLFEAAPHPKRYYEIPGAQHNDDYLVGQKEYLSRIEEFLNDSGL